MTILSSHTFTSSSVAQTQALATTLAEHLMAEDVVLLSGDLGAGKTHFVQGVARGLGIKDPVTSPTFNLVLTYEADSALPLYHFDLYRLETPDDLEDIAFYDIVEADGVSFIEWAEKFPSDMPEDHLSLAITLEGELRVITAQAYGERAQALLSAWVQQVPPTMKA